MTEGKYNKRNAKTKKRRKKKRIYNWEECLKINQTNFLGFDFENTREKKIEEERITIKLENKRKNGDRSKIEQNELLRKIPNRVLVLLI